MGPLRVHIVYEDGAWFAQGLELDYAAEGATLAQAQEHFERGLMSTVLLNTTGSSEETESKLRKLLHPAPSSAWEECLGDVLAERIKPDRRTSDAVRLLPFDSVLYLVRFSTTN
jgi:hypothetical protein